MSFRAGMEVKMLEYFDAAQRVILQQNAQKCERQYTPTPGTKQWASSGPAGGVGTKKSVEVPYMRICM